MRLALTLLLGALALATGARAADVLASPPQTLSVTIYRNPNGRGTIDLDDLRGFALVTETRTVHLPAGESRLRFEGVVDGIEPASAIVSGLPDGVIEKNRDAAVLSPEALVKTAVGGAVTLNRTDPKTGKVTRIRATIRSADADGVVFETANGVEALRCSGLPETFSFDRIPAGLAATPTLSVLTRAQREVTVTVTLSYLADAFDWSANYVAHINPGGRTLNLSGWITLANGNSISLPTADTRVVAGRLNREPGDNDASDDDSSSAQTDIIATCWPQGTTTSGVVQPRPAPEGLLQDAPPPPPAPMMARATEVGAVVVTAEKREIAPEQLGDLKLYRLPESTTVAARQSKQVRLLDRPDVPFTRVTTADLSAGDTLDPEPATVLLRTKNIVPNHLGLPLPSGRLMAFDHSQDRDMMVGSSRLKDTALEEEIETVSRQSRQQWTEKRRVLERVSELERAYDSLTQTSQAQAALSFTKRALTVHTT